MPTVFPFIAAVSLSLACSATADTVTKDIEQKPFAPESKADDYVWKLETLTDEACIGATKSGTGLLGMSGQKLLESLNFSRCAISE